MSTKGSSNLRLVTTGGHVSAGMGGVGALMMQRVEELRSAEKRRVEKVVETLCPNARIIGVSRGERSWDLRPVIRVQKEEHPSIIRFLGPEVALSVRHSIQAESLLKRLTSLKSLKSGMLVWGEFEGQYWYRREVISETLADIMASVHSIVAEKCFEVTKKLLNEVEVWHRSGVVHGHLCPANISLSEDRKISLLDPQTGVLVVQASALLGLDQPGAVAFKESFAPEVISGKGLAQVTDVFNLGRTLTQLFSMIEKTEDGLGVDATGT